MKIYVPKVEFHPPKYVWLLKLFFPMLDESKAIISFGDTIYAPKELPSDFWVHEEKHLQQHRYSRFFGFIYLVRYILSRTFRYKSELEAFRAQYKHAKEHYPAAKAAATLDFCAALLAHPAYGSLTTKEKAFKAIQEGLEENRSKWQGPPDREKFPSYTVTAHRLNPEDMKHMQAGKVIHIKTKDLIS